MNYGVVHTPKWGQPGLIMCEKAAQLDKIIGVWLEISSEGAGLALIYTVG